MLAFCAPFVQANWDKILSYVFSSATVKIFCVLCFLVFGPALLEHCLLEAEFKPGCKFGSGFAIDKGKYQNASYVCVTLADTSAISAYTGALNTIFTMLL